MTHIRTAVELTSSANSSWGGGKGGGCVMSANAATSRLCHARCITRYARGMAHPGGVSAGVEPFKIMFHSTCKKPLQSHKAVQTCISHSDSPIKAPYVSAHVFDPTLSLWFLNNTESAYFSHEPEFLRCQFFFFMETNRVM